MSNFDRTSDLSKFPVRWPVATRWADNDMFGHLNNAVYYQLFDTAINAWINGSTNTDPLAAPWLGVVAESSCQYFAELKFPDELVVGLAVARLGKSSVTYQLGVASVAAERRGGTIAALGRWVHVYVDRSTRKPTPIPVVVRLLLESAAVGSSARAGQTTTAEA